LTKTEEGDDRSHKEGLAMLKKLCHDQVKILLERMDTHPEEFLKEGKWDEFLPPEANAHRGMLTPKFKHFTKIEQYLIRQKYKGIVQSTLRQRAYDSIIETLVFKEEEPWTTAGIFTSGTPYTNASVTSNITSNTLTIGNETLDGQTIKLMKEQLMAMRKMGQI
jgi:hypothetical protein